MQQRPGVTSQPPTRGREAIVVHRIYDPDDEPGYRVLVDRLWPRGLAKGDAALDEWLKDVAPSTDLRRWYGHEPSRFAEFRKRYRDELEQPPASDAAHYPTWTSTTAACVSHSDPRHRAVGGPRTVRPLGSHGPVPSTSRCRRPVMRPAYDVRAPVSDRDSDGARAHR